MARQHVQVDLEVKLLRLGPRICEVRSHGDFSMSETQPSWQLAIELADELREHSSFAVLPVVYGRQKQSLLDRDMNRDKTSRNAWVKKSPLSFR